MHRIPLFIFLLLFQIQALSQAKYDYIWLLGLGNSGGTTMDFNSTPTDVFFEEDQAGSLSNNANICRANGNLLAYSNGCHIFDASHQIMLNGDTINPGEIWEQSCDFGMAWPGNLLFLPFEENNKTFLFHKSQEFSSSPLFITPKLNLTIIQNAGNGVPGEVISKNQAIINDTLSFGGLSAVKNQDGTGWWIITARFSDNHYYKIHVTHNGVDTILEQTIGQPFVLGESGGQDLFTPNGSQYIRYTPNDGIFLFDFDREFGVLSNAIHFEIETDFIFGGAAVSSNSQYLYISTTDKIYQYDLLSQDVESSKILVAEWDGFVSPFPVNFYLMQLAPDCRIYITSNNGVDYLSTINYPNRSGIACEVQQHSIALETNHGASIPNFPNYRLGTPYPFCDSSLVVTSTYLPARQPENDYELFPNPTTHEFSIVKNKKVTAGRVAVYNGQGAKVMNQVFGNSPIDISQLSSGIYLVQVWEKGKIVFVERLVVM